jgi:hypothetical protein
MMWEVAGGIIIAVVVLLGIGALARRLVDKITLRNVHKLRNVIASGELVVSESDLGDELEDDYAKRVQLVRAKCQWSENYITENNKERLEEVIKACLEQARDIDDEFYRSAALHPVADLLSKAGEADRAKDIMALIAVNFLREKAEQQGYGKT